MEEDLSLAASRDGSSSRFSSCLSVNYSSQESNGTKEVYFVIFPQAALGIR